LEELHPTPSWAIDELESTARGVRLNAVTILAQASSADASDTPELTKRLQSQKPPTRYWACAALAAIGPGAQAAVPGLKRLLSDPEPAIRLQAAEAIYRIAPGASPLSSRMIGLLHLPDTITRRRNLYVAGLLPEWLPLVDNKRELVARLSRELIVEARITRPGSPGFREAQVRYDRHRAAIQVLGCIGPEAHAAVPVLIDALINSRGGDHEIFQRALSSIGRPAVAPLIERSRAVDSAAKRSWIWSVLGQMGADMLPDLEPYWQDPDPRVRHGIVTIAEFMRPTATRAIPNLIRALRDPDAEVRRTATISFSEMGSAAVPAVPALIAALSDSDSLVPYYALVSLEGMGKFAKDAVPALARELKDGRKANRQQLVKALGAIGPAAADAMPALIDVFATSDDDTRAQILRAIARIGTEAKLERSVLSESLKAPNWNLQLQAALLLNRLEPENQQARNTLQSLLTTADDKLHSEIFRALPFFPKEFAGVLVRRSASKAHEPIGVDHYSVERLGPDAAAILPDLVWLVRHSHDSRGPAAEAVQALVGIGEPALPTLEQLARDDDAQVRLSVAWALAKLGDKPLALKVLVDAAGHERRHVREQAAYNLSTLASDDATVRSELVKLLDHSDPHVRASAGLALVCLSPAVRDQQIGALSKAVSDPDRDVRFTVVQRLVDVNTVDPRLFPLVATALRDLDATIRAHVVQHLDWVAYDAAILAPLINELTVDPDSEVAQQASSFFRSCSVPRSMLPEPVLLKNPAGKQDALLPIADIKGPPGPPDPLNPAFGDKRFSEWLADLQMGDGDQRAAAAQALHGMFNYNDHTMCCIGPCPPRGKVGIADVPQAIPILVRALSDREADVRSAAAGALSLCGPFAAPAIEPLQKLLADRQCRLAAVNALGELRSTAKAAAEAIRPLLDDDDQRLRIAAAKALWQVSADPQAVRSLGTEFEKLAVSDPTGYGHVQVDIAYYFYNEIGAEAAPLAPMMIKFLRSGSYSTASAAARVLAAIGPSAKEATPALIELIDKPHINREALLALASLGPSAKDAVPVLVRLYHQSVKEPANPRPALDGEERQRMVIALGQIKEPQDEVISLLIEALGDRSRFVRAAACQMLVHFGSKAAPAVPALGRMVREDKLGFGGNDGFVACMTLAELGPVAEHAVPDLIGFIDKPNGNRAIDALGRIGPAAQAAVPALKKKLDVPHLAIPAAVALWRIGERETGLHALEEKTDAGDYQAVGAMADLGPETHEAATWLHQAIESQRLGENLADCLLRLSPDDELAIKLLKKQMASDDPMAAYHAAATLWQIKRLPKARAALELTRYRSDQGLRMAAARALAAARLPKHPGPLLMW
jgi:HEAT repeat protein